MIPTIRIDGTRALARFSPSGIPAQVRRNLRSVIPDLTKKLGANVDARLAAGLKSRRSLTTVTEMRENPERIVGRVAVVATTGPALLPQWLDTGTRPHWIYPRVARSLYFFWERVGAYVSFKKVWHPGFAGLGYMQGAFVDMEDEIFDKIEKAVRDGVKTGGT